MFRTLLIYVFFVFSYEPVHAKIVRNFQKQNITREDPQAYLKRFGTQLFDSNIVIQKARAAGVVEDLVKNFYFFTNYQIVYVNFNYCRILH